MLKPSRKILRKEIKKDPFLETFEKIENGFQENRKIVINVLIFFVAIIIIGSIYINNHNKIKLESSSAFGAALVAYSKSDYDNAKFQFESVVSNYEGTKSGILANYYLGKIAYERNDFNEAKMLLNKFLDNTKNPMLVCGAVKQLVSISFQDQNYLKSFEIIDKVKKFNLKNFSRQELKILEVIAYIKIDDLKNARDKIFKILKDENLTGDLKQKVHELEGMIHM